MNKIKLIKDKECNIDIKQLSKLINKKTKRFKVEIEENDYIFNEKLIKSFKTVDKYEKLLFNNSKTRSKSGECTILVTEIPYSNNYFIEGYMHFSILSFYGWEYLTELPKENGLLYWICDQALSDIQINHDSHRTNIGCINDFLVDKRGIDMGMRQAGLCAPCLAKLEEKKLSTNEKAVLKDIQILLDYLSQKSRWNKSFFEEEIDKKEPATLKKRKSVVKNTIRILIASPSDTLKERELLINKLDRQFLTSGQEVATGYRTITSGWEDLASQPGYAQEIINNILLNRTDIVLGVLKHKLGTPTKDKEGNIKAESGTAEEIYYALEDNPDSTLGMLYVYSKAPSPSLNDKNIKEIQKNWKRVEEFKRKMQSKVLYKVYNSENELLDMVVQDVAKNILTYFKK